MANCTYTCKRFHLTKLLLHSNELSTGLVGLLYFVRCYINPLPVERGFPAHREERIVMAL